MTWVIISLVTLSLLIAGLAGQLMALNTKVKGLHERFEKLKPWDWEPNPAYYHTFYGPRMNIKHLTLQQLHQDLVQVVKHLGMRFEDKPAVHTGARRELVSLGTSQLK